MRGKALTVLQCQTWIVISQLHVQYVHAIIIRDTRLQFNNAFVFIFTPITIRYCEFLK